MRPKAPDRMIIVFLAGALVCAACARHSSAGAPEQAPPPAVLTLKRDRLQVGADAETKHKPSKRPRKSAAREQPREDEPVDDSIGYIMPPDARDSAHPATAPLVSAAPVLGAAPQIPVAPVAASVNHPILSPQVTYTTAPATAPATTPAIRPPVHGTTPPPAIETIGRGHALAPEQTRIMSLSRIAAATPPPVLAPPPLTLALALEATRQSNPDLEEAAKRVTSADYILERARAELYPQLTFNANYQASNNALRKFSYLLGQNVTNPNLLFNAGPSEDNLDLQLHATYMIYNGGAREAQIRGAVASSEAAAASLEALRNRMTYQVAEAYYRYFQARDLLAVRREAVDLVKSQLETVRAQIAANSAVRADALAIELHLAQVQQGLITAQTTLALSRAVLESVVGVRLRAGELPEIPDSAPWAEHVAKIEAAAHRYEDPNDPTTIDAISEADQNRAELEQSEGGRRAAEAKLDIALAARRPTVAISADMDTIFSELDQTRATYFVALAVSLNVFDFGRIKSDIKHAEAELSAALSKHQRTRLDIELDVRRALLGLEDAKSKLAVSRSAVANARENLSLTESRYRNQMITVTNLFDAQVAATEARVSVATARAEVDIAAVNVERAIGRLSEFSREVLSTQNDPEIVKAIEPK